MPNKTVAFAIDWKFFEPLLVAAESLLAAWDRSCSMRLVIVADEGKAHEEKAIERLAASHGAFVSLERRSPPVELGTLPSVGHLSPSAFTRIFLPELLTDCDQLLYLDADILVLGDLSEWPDLHTTQLGLATENQPSKRLADIDGIPYCHSEPGYRRDLPLRNSGVLVMNAARGEHRCESVRFRPSLAIATPLLRSRRNQRGLWLGSGRVAAGLELAAYRWRHPRISAGTTLHRNQKAVEQRNYGSRRKALDQTGSQSLRRSGIEEAALATQ
jgi:hypothetical protein